MQVPPCPTWLIATALFPFLCSAVIGLVGLVKPVQVCSYGHVNFVVGLVKHQVLCCCWYKPKDTFQCM